ncbi:MAG: nucleotide exchange factor GrpE [Lachnospiraceae bacterium]
MENVTIEETETETKEENDIEIEEPEAEEQISEEEKSKEQPNEENTQDTKGFRKKQKPDKKQDKLKEKIEELEDKTKRQMAEFDNFRKRSEKEKSQMFELGAKSVIEKILPVVDNFERGLEAIPEADRGNPFEEGMSKIYKQMMTELDSIGVKPIEAIGTEFNPDFHNAVMQVESEEYETGIVAQELQKGYLYRDSVVRHSMVAVVQ